MEELDGASPIPFIRFIRSIWLWRRTIIMRLASPSGIKAGSDQAASNEERGTEDEKTGTGSGAGGGSSLADHLKSLEKGHNTLKVIIKDADPCIIVERNLSINTTSISVGNGREQIIIDMISRRHKPSAQIQNASNFTGVLWRDTQIHAATRAWIPLRNLVTILKTRIRDINRSAPYMGARVGADSTREQLDGCHQGIFSRQRSKEA
jgi:hypothetical protein